ncbi:methionine synthase reductase [Dendroctonus ponderosae]|uniref:methionine synthase reductase n=1 Tax=Dendroctonus ponderosae TaxID=77166 RepID=UPI0020357B8C|nr:methionine synthase reductase [Dendroctonus ponderosae]KAH1012590.1 hypothetical protein HUJ05_011723 [Dendroctonus ponderosae]
MANFLKIAYDSTEAADITKDSYEHRNTPFANSSVYEAFVEESELLTEGDDVKPTYRLRLDVKDYDFNFLPGDVIGILPENNSSEVQKLLNHLNLTSVCHWKYHLSIQEGSKKKIPKHLPPSSTLYEVFLKHICLRSAPKKLFLKNLIKYTDDVKEKALLEQVCAPTGSAEYIKLLETTRSLLALLESFPSCQPPVEVILEHSSPLNPRCYSIASSPLSNQLWILFNVLEMSNSLKGVCTSWLEQIIKAQDFSKRVPIYFRKPGKFHMDNSVTAKILVATGSGLAPFMGFLDHKSLGGSVADMWLFYGCRYSDRDFLCKKDLLNYAATGTLGKKCWAFSRDGKKKEYVQDKIEENKEEFAKWIFEKEAMVFVCGELKTVVRDVKEAIVESIMTHKKCEKATACLVLEELVKCDRIIIDSWL